MAHVVALSQSEANVASMISIIIAKAFSRRTLPSNRFEFVGIKAKAGYIVLSFRLPG